ncbi:type III-B CRISPR-associated protein Cas10/Cmr2 [Myxococcota bacterium]|nr:type III-B CRISPR-associated protein Cas10/Cmr2 [Myxococcota bacterium]
MSPDATQRLKLEALLLPTPLCWIAPDGEVERAGAVRGLFMLPPPSETEQKLLGQASEDAEAAITGLTRSPRGAAPTALRHPLGGDSGSAPITGEALKAAWEKWLGSLSKFSERVHEEAGWRELVREVREHELFTRTPNDPALPDHSVAAHRVLTAALIGAREAGDAALLLVQVGPVQPFIEASRRTRDLWAGSYLMSLMSAKVVACLMKELGPEAIITPQPESSALLRRIVYGDKDVTDSDALQPALPAKVMALVPLDRAEALGEACVKALDELWERLWERCERRIREQLGDRIAGWEEGAKAQRDAFLERSYTVQPWPKHATPVWDYVAKVQAALDPTTPTPPDAVRASLGASYGAMSGALWAIHSAQRSATVPTSHVGDHRFKCRVCGQREALGPLDAREQRAFWRALSDQVGSFELKPTEQLCAICLMKRLGVVGLVKEEVGLDGDGETEARSYPSVPSLACAPFRYKMICAVRDNKDGARETIRRWVDALQEAIKELPGQRSQNIRSGIAKVQALANAADRDTREFATKINEIDGPWFDEDAYEPERAWTEQVGERPNLNDKKEKFKTFSTLLLKAAPLWRDVTDLLDDKPSQYVAAIYLDGDQLSRWLNGSHEKTPTYGALMGPNVPKELAETHRAISPALQGELSSRLSALAGGAVKKVVDEHFGRLVYCGGDDVVALLPAQHALQCADELAKLIQEPGYLGSQVTVSAGIHIQHQREALGRLIKGAREAEKASKKRRDQLTVRLTPRSGDGLTVTLPWRVNTERSVVLLNELAGVKADDSSESPLNLKLGHVLRAELMTLGYRPDDKYHGKRPDWKALEPIIRGRMRVLANAIGDTEDRALRLPLDLLALDEGNPDRLVKTLLLARFLAREARVNGESS